LRVAVATVLRAALTLLMCHVNTCLTARKKNPPKLAGHEPYRMIGRFAIAR
jgi:hypothetical protein